MNAGIIPPQFRKIYAQLSATAPFNRILPHIGAGRRNAVHMGELIQLSGMSDREMRKNIEAIRRKGLCIASGDYGYYIPVDYAQAAAYLRKEEKRARSIFLTLRSTRTAVDAFEQGELYEACLLDDDAQGVDVADISQEVDW